MKPSLERRLHRLEQQSAPGRAPLRLCVLRPGIEPHGLHAHPDGPHVARLPGESVAALQTRCAALHPGVVIWRATPAGGHAKA